MTFHTVTCSDCKGIGAYPGTKADGSPEMKRCRTCNLRGVIEVNEPDPPSMYGYCKCGESIERNDYPEHVLMCAAHE